MTAVHFYGDLQPDGSREFLESLEWPEGKHMTSEQFKSVLINMMTLDFFTNNHKVIAYLYSGSSSNYSHKIVFKSAQFGSEVWGYYFINGNLFKTVNVAC